MKIVLLGAGGMGEIALKDLVDSGVKQIVIADYNRARVESLVKGFKGQGMEISAAFVDANDRASLIKVMKDASVVASAIGPFSEYGMTLSQQLMSLIYITKLNKLV
jgi:saccharopine dehydrogenase-like NADP-dependent oxidoreductase